MSQWFRLTAGLMQAIQNLGLALMTMVSGAVVDRHGYLWLENFFIFWLVIALICTTIIWILDWNGDGYLNMTTSKREIFDEKKRAAKEEEERREEIQRQRTRPRTNMEIRSR